MTKLTAPFRRATSEDAVDMAELVNMAGDGLPLYLWAKFARPGQAAWDVGRERARHGLDDFAYKNIVVREEAGKVAACLIGYPLGESQERAPQEIAAFLAPLLELQDMVRATWYVNVLATYPEHRGKGFGTELLRIGERMASEAQNERMSLIASDANTKARRLYDKNGYVEYAARPIVKEDWEHSGQNWVLLVKDL